MLRAAFAACLLMIIFGAAQADQWWLDSYGPIPCPSEIGQAQQCNPRAANTPIYNHQGETQSTPLVVRIINPPDATSITDELAKARNERTANDNFTLLFSVMLGGVGLIQAFVIIYTAKVANKAANAARDAANATTASVVLADKTSKRELRAYLCVRTAVRSLLRTGVIIFKPKLIYSTPAKPPRIALLIR